MSFGGGFFGGGEKRITTTSTSTSFQKTADQRIGVEGGLGGGQVVGHETAVAQATGAVAGRVGDYGTLTQTVTGNKYKVGMTGAEVAKIVQQANLGFASATAMMSHASDQLQQLATTALGSVQQAQTGIPADWTKYLVPVGVLVVVAMFIKRRKAA